LIDLAKHHQDILTTMALGEHWKTAIAPGVGEYFNVNAGVRRTKYANVAIGCIKVTDQKVISGLEFIAAYFTLAGYFMKLRTDLPCRTFGRSAKPEVNRGIGRPPNVLNPLLRPRFRDVIDRLSFL
jgi:hypothetical protein